MPTQYQINITNNNSDNTNYLVFCAAQYSTAFCGMGKTQPFSNPSNVIPVATWTAKSSINYKIYPKIQYFISTGEYHSGDIVDVATLGQFATIDFTGKKETVAQVTQKDDGTFAPVTYSFMN